LTVQQGEKSIKIGKLNRDKIIVELWKSPLTFTALKEKVGLSGKTLSQHLNNLRAEGLVRRKIEGKYILYTVEKPRTLLNMRKDFLNELEALANVYWPCLDKETSILFRKACKALQESVTHHEPEADTDKIVRKTIPIPAGFRGEIIQSDNIYEKPELVKTKTEFKIKKRHSRLAKKRRVMVN
jgi:DNA-binding HxlR family transcriptional regulator